MVVIIVNVVLALVTAEALLLIGDEYLSEDTFPDVVPVIILSVAFSVLFFLHSVWLSYFFGAFLSLYYLFALVPSIKSEIRKLLDVLTDIIGLSFVTLMTMIILVVSRGWKKVFNYADVRSYESM